MSNRIYVIFPRTKKSPRTLHDVKETANLAYPILELKYSSVRNDFKISNKNVSLSWIGYNEFDFYDDVKREIWSLFI